jgi:hypothetical protein
MFHTFRSPLVGALAALCIASAVALAAGTTVFGTIQNVDADQGRLTLRAGENKILELQAPAELLAGLQTGDAVEVKMFGQKATMILKQGEAQQPEIGGALLQQQPDGLRPSP